MVAHRVAVVVLTVGFAYLSGRENGAKHKKAICNLSLTIKGMSRGYIRLMKSPDSISGPWKMNS